MGCTSVSHLFKIEKMKKYPKYTVGIYFDAELEKVALLLKNRPTWQANKLNFPGGHIDEGEEAIDCVVREFKEECDLTTTKDEWYHIGRIINEDNYEMEIFTSFHHASHGDLITNEDQDAMWVDIKNLPINVISNLRWLIPYALNCLIKGNNPDRIVFGSFEYTYK